MGVWVAVCATKDRAAAFTGTSRTTSEQTTCGRALKEGTEPLQRRGGRRGAQEGGSSAVPGAVAGGCDEKKAGRGGSLPASVSLLGQPLGRVSGQAESKAAQCPGVPVLWAVSGGGGHGLLSLGAGRKPPPSREGGAAHRAREIR